MHRHHHSISVTYVKETRWGGGGGGYPVNHQKRGEVHSMRVKDTLDSKAHTTGSFTYRLVSAAVVVTGFGTERNSVDGEDSHRPNRKARLMCCTHCLLTHATATRGIAVCQVSGRCHYYTTHVHVSLVVMFVFLVCFCLGPGRRELRGPLC